MALPRYRHYFFLLCSGHHRDLHSFPTRRSSDLAAPTAEWLREDASVICARQMPDRWTVDRKSTRLNSSHTVISYAVFCLKKKTAIPASAAKPKDRTEGPKLTVRRYACAGR